ncbi:MAG: tetratricopeptide repeat protein [Bacteroidetes bacterium]|nr:tetratricopeptide repeat protein [Bacteroidota bacterium]
MKQKSKEKPKEKPAQKTKTNSWFEKNKLLVCLLVIVTIVFANSIPNKYALDDEFFTTKRNKLVEKGIKAIPSIFTNRTFTTNDGEGYEYRPLVAVSFAIEHQFFGANPHVSHSISLLLYLLIAILLFRLLQKWFTGQGEWIIFFIALLFLIHPLRTEVVDNIKSRDELLSILGSLACIWFAFRFHETGKWVYSLLYPLCFIAGVLSKHSSVTYVVLVPLTLYFFTKLEYKKIFLYALPLLSVIIFVSVMQRAVLPHATRHMLLLENPLVSMKMTLLERTATASYVMGRYLWLHIIPHPLVYYYGFKFVPIVSWTSVLPIVSLLIHLALFVYALFNFKKKDSIAFGIFFYLLNMAAFSNLLKPAPGLMAERFTFSASIGFSIAFCFFVFRYFKIDSSKFSWNSDSKKAGYLLCSIAVLFALTSISRNADWKDKITLYTHDMEYLAESSKGNMMYANATLTLFHENTNRAVQLSQNGNTMRDSVRYYAGEAKRNLMLAQEHFRAATEITPTYSIAWINLGSTYYFQNKYAEALHYSQEGLKLDPDSKEGVYNSAMAYNSLGKKDSAEIFFNRVLEIDSNDVNAHDQLGKFALAKGDTTTATKYYMDCIMLNPNTENAYVNAAQFFLKIKNQQGALQYTEMAAKVNPRNMVRMKNLATYYQQQGNAEKANYYFQKMNEARSLK